MEFIDITSLAAYPGVVLRSSAVNDQTIELANGVVSEALFGIGGTEDLDPVPTRVKAITLEVAARALRNPEGYDSVTRQIDDWKETTRREHADVRPGVYLTDEERDELSEIRDAARDRSRNRAKSIRLRVPGYAADC